MMIHFKPWNYQQQMLTDENYHYVVNDLQNYYTLMENQEEYDHINEKLPSETSSDQGQQADTFRLAFEAAQWSKLVSSAEGLFNQLMSTYSPNEHNLLKNQIEQWLCLKQEYEECIACDDSGSLQGFTENTKRSLERIEEVTETDEKTDESDSWEQLKQRRKSFCSETEISDEDLDLSDEDSDDAGFLAKVEDFKKKLGKRADDLVNSKKNDCDLNDIISNITPEPNTASNAFIKSTSTTKSSKRKSILPYSDMSNELIEFQKKNSHLNFNSKIQNDFNATEDFYLNGKNDGKGKSEESINKNLNKELVEAQNVSLTDEHADLVKILLAENEEKQSQMNKINHELELANKQLEELDKIIKVKEQFIQDMMKYSNVRNSAKQKFLRKQNELEKKCKNVKKVRSDKKKYGATTEEIEKDNKLLAHYQRKLEHNKVIIDLIGNSKKTINFLEKSLITSKEQLEELKKEVSEKKEHINSLKDELSMVKSKMKEVKEIYSLAASKLERSSLKNKSSFFKKLIRSDSKNEYIGKTDVSSSKEGLERQEINELRQMKAKINDSKFVLEKDKRQWLILNEYIETIDAVIEQKNFMYCGSTQFDKYKSIPANEEVPIKDCLKKLSHDEIITLFCKYIFKVVDLKESSKNLEIHNAMLEESFKKKNLENELKDFLWYHSYENRINLLAHYYEKTNNNPPCDKLVLKEKEVLKPENHQLSKLLTSNPRLLNALRPTKIARSDVKQEASTSRGVTFEGNGRKIVFHAKK